MALHNPIDLAQSHHETHLPSPRTALELPSDQIPSLYITPQTPPQRQHLTTPPSSQTHPLLRRQISNPRPFIVAPSTPPSLSTLPTVGEGFGGGVGGRGGAATARRGGGVGGGGAGEGGVKGEKTHRRTKSHEIWLADFSPRTPPTLTRLRSKMGSLRRKEKPSFKGSINPSVVGIITPPRPERPESLRLEEHLTNSIAKTMAADVITDMTATTMSSATATSPTSSLSSVCEESSPIVSQDTGHPILEVGRYRSNTTSSPTTPITAVARPTTRANTTPTITAKTRTKLPHRPSPLNLTQAKSIRARHDSILSPLTPGSAMIPIGNDAVVYGGEGVASMVPTPLFGRIGRGHVRGSVSLGGDVLFGSNSSDIVASRDGVILDVPRGSSLRHSWIPSPAQTGQRGQGQGVEMVLGMGIGLLEQELFTTIEVPPLELHPALALPSTLPQPEEYTSSGSGHGNSNRMGISSTTNAHEPWGTTMRNDELMTTNFSAIESAGVVLRIGYPVPGPKSPSHRPSTGRSEKHPQTRVYHIPTTLPDGTSLSRTCDILPSSSPPRLKLPPTLQFPSPPLFMACEHSLASSFPSTSNPNLPPESRSSSLDLQDPSTFPPMPLATLLTTHFQTPGTTLAASPFIEMGGDGRWYLRIPRSVSSEGVGMGKGIEIEIERLVSAWGSSGARGGMVGIGIAGVDGVAAVSGVEGLASVAGLTSVADVADMATIPSIPATSGLGGYDGREDVVGLRGAVLVGCDSSGDVGGGIGEGCYSGDSDGGNTAVLGTFHNLDECYNSDTSEDCGLVKDDIGPEKEAEDAGEQWEVDEEEDTNEEPDQQGMGKVRRMAQYYDGIATSPTTTRSRTVVSGIPGVEIVFTSGSECGASSECDNDNEDDGGWDGKEEGNEFGVQKCLSSGRY